MTKRARGKGRIEKVGPRKFSIELCGGRDPRTGTVYHLPSADEVPGVAYTVDIPENARAVKRIEESDGGSTRAAYRRIKPSIKYRDATDEQRAACYWQTPVRYLREYDTIVGTKRDADLRVEEMRVEIGILQGILERGIDKEDLASVGLSLQMAREENMDAPALAGEYERLREDQRGIVFSTLCEDYLSMREKRGNKRENTLKSDRVYSKHLLRALGDMKLADIKPGTVTRMYADMTAAGIGPTTIKQSHGLLKRIMQTAVYDELIERNPVDMVETPKVSKPKRNALSGSEAARLQGLVLDGEPTAYKMAVLIALSLGARLGEVLGLEWRHIVTDGDRPHVHIVQQYLSNGETGPLKTDDDGNPIGRVVPLDATTIRRLTEWKSTQRAILLEYGIEQGERTPVVSTCTGGYVNRSNLRTWFCSWCADHGFARWVDDDGVEIVELVYGEDDASLHPDCIIEWRDPDGWPCDGDGRRFSRTHKRPAVKRHYDGLVFHELRHTHFTLRAQSGTSITVAQALGGWSTPRMLTDTYMHATPEAIWEEKSFSDTVLREVAEHAKA